MEGLLSDVRQYKLSEIRCNHLYTLLVNARWDDLLESNEFKMLLEMHPKEANLSDEALLHVAVGCFLIFVQHNFLGPPVVLRNTVELAQCAEQLRSDGEELNVNVALAECLLVCQKVFDYLVRFEDCLTVRLWYQRYLLIHQRCLDDVAHSLYVKFDENVTILENALETAERVIKIEVFLEILYGYIQYRRVTKAEEWIEKLRQVTHVNVVCVGALGFRTRFQLNPLPQLALTLHGWQALGLPSAAETHGNIELPSMLKHQDDLRLEKLFYVEAAKNEDLQYPALIQNLLLAKLYFLHVSHPKILICDELRCFMAVLVYQKFGPWMTRVATLFLNASIDVDHRRTVHRSYRQLEDLVRKVRCFHPDDPPIADRLSMAFTSWFIPRWQMQEKLADVNASLGMMKSALDMYKTVQSWDKVINCYTALEERHMAAAVIRQLIENGGPSVRLCCMLGDATDDVECYRQAWLMSNETSALAKRHWGNFYFVRKDYANAIEHLRRSIEINCMQEPILLRLGYSALQLERWEEAAYAYRLYTSFESHGFEAWNNLAKAYIKLGQKERAHKILQEALKCNFDNWMVWENFMIVSVDTRNFEDALNAYAKLLEMKNRYYDKQVLEILVRAIVTGEMDADGHSCTRLKDKAITVLGLACTKVSNEGYLCELAAELEGTDLLRRSEKLQMAYRTYTQSNTRCWEVAESCWTIVNVCMELCEYSLKAYYEGKDNPERVFKLRSQLSSARLAAQACLKGARKEHEKQFSEEINSLDDLIAKIIAALPQGVAK